MRLHPGRRDRLSGPDGRALFDVLLYRRAEPFFYDFDCLWLDGRDLSGLPLIERKRILQGIVPRQPSRLLLVDHIAERGVDLFRAVCEMDLEGIVRSSLGRPPAPTRRRGSRSRTRPTTRPLGGGSG